MLYRAIGLMSGSSLDGLDISFAEYHHNGGKWTYEFIAVDCFPYPSEWADKLKNAIHLSARDYQLLHIAYGQYLGEQVNRFIDQYQLHYKVALIASHGHTTFHMPSEKMTAQLGDGASIAALTQLPVVSDLRNMDMAFGGQGAPIVPIGEKLLLGDYQYFLNIGGIANISLNSSDQQLAFDICPANRVLNMLAADAGKQFDGGGEMARQGTVHPGLLDALNGLPYYAQLPPKSLANDVGTDIIYPMIIEKKLSVPDALRTMVEHIVFQIDRSIDQFSISNGDGHARLLATGGGAFNQFLVEQLQQKLAAKNIEVIVADERLVNYKEALVMGLIGVLRWRQEYNVLSSVTGSTRNSIGGALWTGQEA